MLKVYCEILVSSRLVQNFEISDLAMAKFEKVNIAVTEIRNVNDHLHI
jgi:hypothetical protein